MLDIKRKIDELVAIYSMEDAFCDVYVEGPSDKSIIENFLDYKNLGKSVLEIDDVDLSETKDKYPDLNLLSNKDKLIALSRELSSSLIVSKVKCIVDRDFDGILSEIHVNNHLIYTDYSCIESYILNNKNIEKILKIGIKNFPFNTVFIITEISKILHSLFLLRLINKNFNFNFDFPKIENKLAIDKATGICNFNFDNYLDMYINVNRLRERRDEIKKFVSDISASMQSDVRYNMNGHDFINILFNYINKIKNTPNFKVETFERAVFLSVQPDYLEDYELFKTLSD